MSIIDNIKEELIKRIEGRINLCRYNHNTELSIIFENFDFGEGYSKGRLEAIDDELIFLDRLKAFVERF